MLNKEGLKNSGTHLKELMSILNLSARGLAAEVEED